MRESRFTDGQVVKILREADAAPVPEAEKERPKKLAAERDLEIEVTKQISRKQW